MGLGGLFERAPEAGNEIQMRPYQTGAIQAVKDERKKGINRTLLVLATGLGKTTIFSEFTRQRATRGQRVLILAHRDELIEQAVRRLKDQCGIIAGVEMGQQKHMGQQVIVASVATVGRSGSDRPAGWRPDIIITDEAHHASSKTYMNVYRRFGVFEGNCFHLGVTATDYRLDNKPLSGTEKAVFESVAYRYGIVEGIRDGFLCDVRCQIIESGFSLKGVRSTAGDYNQKQLAEVMDTSSMNAQSLDIWESRAKDRRTIVFCSSVLHAQHMAAIWNERGYRAGVVHGETHPQERRETLRQFGTGELQVVCNMGVLTEGFDAPGIDCVYLLRPTQSWSLFVQMVGRGLRIAPGKKDCLVLDVTEEAGTRSLATKPTLAAVADLPSGADISKTGLKEAALTWNGLTDEQKRHLANRTFDFGRLSEYVRDIDLLAALETPDWMLEVTRLKWVPVFHQHGEAYRVGCGNNRDTGDRRRITVAPNALGAFDLRVDEGDRMIYHETRETAEAAVRVAEDFVEQRWNWVFGFASRDSKWLVDKATPKQVAFIRKKLPKDSTLDPARMTKGQASAWMTAYFEGNSQ